MNDNHPQPNDEEEEELLPRVAAKSTAAAAAAAQSAVDAPSTHRRVVTEDESDDDGADNAFMFVAEPLAAITTQQRPVATSAKPMSSLRSLGASSSNATTVSSRGSAALVHMNATAEVLHEAAVDIDEEAIRLREDVPNDSDELLDMAAFAAWRERQERRRLLNRLPPAAGP